MKYCIFFVVLLAVSCKENRLTHKAAANAASASHIRLSKSDTNLVVVNDSFFLKGTPFEGYLYQLYPNQKDTFCIEGYSNGILHGVVKKYYPGMQPMEWRAYTNGAKNGKQLSYWQNGNKRFEFTASNDACEGELKEWSANGSLFHLAHFKNGQEEGAQKLWYNNGKIKANYVIINGRRYGLLGTKNCANVSDSIFNVK